jgi:hypothetical protein
MGNNKFGGWLAVLVCLLGVSSAAQVSAVGKATDPVGKVLQRDYIAQLQQLSKDAVGIHFRYPFYFSQALDIDEARQKQLAQGSIHFDKFNSQTVLAISGNYYISYSAERMNRNQRARKTYEDVVLPLLKVAVARLDRSVPFEAYAIEVSHHVRTRVLKVDTEGAENVMMLFQRGAAEKLVRASDTETRQGALMESEVFVNGEPFTLWLSGDDAPAEVKSSYLARHVHGDRTQTTLVTEPPEPGTLVNAKLIPESNLANIVRERARTPKDVSPMRLQKLQATYDPTLQRLVPELKSQAHLVDYAPPSFIAFRDGAYLQLNMTTKLEQPVGSSQYKVAAMAFESHISHLARPVTKYFHDSPQFEGIDFSTSVHQSVEPSSVSVEFVVPFSALACYEKYDCTGQDLINRSVILINGERVTLDLERAEADAR